MLTKSVHYHIRALRNIRLSISVEMFLRYRKNISKLQRAQNLLARVVTGSFQFISQSPQMALLVRWFPIEYRFYFETSLSTVSIRLNLLICLSIFACASLLLVFFGCQIPNCSLFGARSFSMSKCVPVVIHSDITPNPLFPTGFPTHLGPSFCVSDSASKEPLCAFTNEKCLAHSPLRATSRSFTRCR